MTDDALHQFDICFIHDVDPQQLRTFLTQAFNAQKADFLMQHSDWWHRDSPARFVAVEHSTDSIVGYCALIRSQVLLDDKPHDMYWWIDLIILPAYRGLGIQRLLDEAAKQTGHTQLGFPNALAAIIHRKHGWGVRTEGTRWQYTLNLTASARLRAYDGATGRVLRTLARVLNPAFRVVKRAGLLSVSHPHITVTDEQKPDPLMLATIFTKHHPTQGTLTTQRDADFIRWRYLQAPYRDQLRFFIAYDQQQPVLALITRLLTVKGLKTLRILDVFGDLHNREALTSLLNCAQQEAVRCHADHILIVVTHDALAGPLRDLRFVRDDDNPLAFCWLSDSDEQMHAIEQLQPYWVFADSDLDYSD